MAIPGKLQRTSSGKVEFMPDNTLTPYYNYPVKPKDDTTGCIVMYQAPYRENGQIPDWLYFICHDPYAHDETTGPSIGATYVIKRINNFSKPDDIIVASYIGRPSTQDEYNSNLFMLSEYYNAMIGFENDRGDVMGYAKRFNKLRLLVPEMQLSFDKDLVSSGVNRKYGMHMTPQRKAQGEIYYRDWLLTERSVDAQGNKVCNLHYINDPGLLEESIKYVRDPKRNFDRVSAIIIGMYLSKEMDWLRDIKAMHKKNKLDPDYFFNRQFYQ
jgi:hypothetical protein